MNQANENGEEKVELAPFMIQYYTSKIKNHLLDMLDEFVHDFQTPF
jgi:hypothetical protein